MIVFWRLFLAYFLTDFVFFHKTINQIRNENRARGMIFHGIVFLLWSFALCYGYLTMKWPFLEVVDLPGWVCIVLFGMFHVFTDEFFQFGGRVKHGFVLTFFLKNMVNLLFLFLCVPFHALYETGNFFAEPWIIFCAGLICATRVLGWGLLAFEQDRYGANYVTFDERLMLMMVRSIFFLIMLLPGWRWTVLLAVWLGACIYARKIRLMDISNFVFYLGAVGAVLIGFLVRLRFYLV